jgi:hypothetical protein
VEFREHFIAVDQLDATFVNLLEPPSELVRPRGLPLRGRQLVTVMGFETTQQQRCELAPLIVGEVESLLGYGLEGGRHDRSVAPELVLR